MTLDLEQYVWPYWVSVEEVGKRGSGEMAEWIANGRVDFDLGEPKYLPLTPLSEKTDSPTNANTMYLKHTTSTVQAIP